jgi:CRP/FNR family transcriptional regulator
LIQRLLPAVPPNAADDVVRTSHLLTYRAGETILGPDEPWSPGIVVDGRVRLTIRSNDGREATLRLVERGTLFGLVALFQDEPERRQVERSLVAVERSTVVLFETAVFSRLGQHHSAFAMHLVRALVESENDLFEAAAQLAFMTVRQRVAAHLLRISAPQREDSSVLLARLTQQQLADAVGSVREVVARTLHDLRLAGIVEVSRARVTIVDREGLWRTAYHVT